jgi:hypothetical protein
MLDTFAMQQGGTQYRRLVGAFQRIFGASIFFGTDSQRERAAVVIPPHENRGAVGAKPSSADNGTGAIGSQPFAPVSYCARVGRWPSRKRMNMEGLLRKGFIGVSGRRPNGARGQQTELMRFQQEVFDGGGI